MSRQSSMVNSIGSNSKATYVEGQSTVIDAKIRMTPIKNAIISGLSALKYTKKQDHYDLDYTDYNKA